LKMVSDDNWFHQPQFITNSDFDTTCIGLELLVSGFNTVQMYHKNWMFCGTHL
jgi:hypothetical protein